MKKFFEVLFLSTKCIFLNKEGWPSKALLVVAVATIISMGCFFSNAFGLSTSLILFSAIWLILGIIYWIAETKKRKGEEK
jgi:hypothetical protein